jgi:hypothetical protein
MHEGVETIRRRHSMDDATLKGIKLPGVREVGRAAFCSCEQLIEEGAYSCPRLRRIAIPLKYNNNMFSLRGLYNNDATSLMIAAI